MRDALAGLAAAHAGMLRVHTDPDYVARADAPLPGKVAMVSGRRFGPRAHARRLRGQRACSTPPVPAQVFTSPMPDQMLAATKAVDGGAGVLHIVKNYTGDVLNFEMAAELAGDEGIAVDSVVIDDDVAVQDSLHTAGRRGVGATVLAEKICGAAAEQGRPLADGGRLGRRVNARRRSMGVALTSCTVPTAGKPTFELGPTTSSSSASASTASPAASGARCTGGRRGRRPGGEPSSTTCPSPRATRARLRRRPGRHAAHRALHRLSRAREVLAARGITIARNLVGPYMTALDMAGCSISLLRLDDELTALWDAPVVTPGLRWGA